MNYLIDESDSVGKGANCVVSLVHHYLETNSSSGQEVLLHADNAVGQNKNNTVIQYLCWRVLTGKNSKLKISFMVAGHTKFAPDRFFGLVKKTYRRTSVSSLPDIENVIQNSSITGKNIPLPTIDCNGKRNVTWYNWSDFLSQSFNTLPGITRYHHFRFDSLAPGSVFVRENCKEPETTIVISKKDSAVDILGMPEVILPPGMSLERQVYLFEKIRRFCSSAAAELTCPKPYTTENPLPAQQEKQSQSQRKCSHCREPGHTKTVRGVITCPQLLKE